MFHFFKTLLLTIILLTPALWFCGRMLFKPEKFLGMIKGICFYDLDGTIRGDGVFGVIASTIGIIGLTCTGLSGVDELTSPHLTGEGRVLVLILIPLLLLMISILRITLYAIISKCREQ